MWQVNASICSLSYAAQNLLIKGLTRRKCDSKTILWVMFLAAVPVLFCFYIVLADPSYTSNFPYYLVAGVLLNLLAFYGYVRALELADVSLVIPLISLSPLFMLLTSWLMVSEVPDLSGLGGILLVVVGTYFLSGGRADFVMEPLISLVDEPGPRWALMVAVLWSVTANIDKLTVQASSPLAYTFWFHLFFALAFTPIYFWMSDDASDESTSELKFNWILVGLVGAGFLQAILAAFQMIALTGTQVTYVIAIKRAGMLISVLGGGMFFGEEELPRRFLAALLVLFGLLAIMFR